MGEPIDVDLKIMRGAAASNDADCCVHRLDVNAAAVLTFSTGLITSFLGGPNCM